MKIKDIRRTTNGWSLVEENEMALACVTHSWRMTKGGYDRILLYSVVVDIMLCFIRDQDGKSFHGAGNNDVITLILSIWIEDHMISVLEFEMNFLLATIRIHGVGHLPLTSNPVPYCIPNCYAYGGMLTPCQWCSIPYILYEKWIRTITTPPVSKTSPRPTSSLVTPMTMLLTIRSVILADGRYPSPNLFFSSAFDFIQ